MEGPAGSRGLTQQAVSALFDQLPEGKQIYFQYVQLYDSDFLDLLNPEVRGDKLTIVEGENFLFLKGAEFAQASSAGAMLKRVTGDRCLPGPPLVFTWSATPKSCMT